MQGGFVVAEDSLNLSSVLSSSRLSYLPLQTKIVGTLGLRTHSVDKIVACLNAGMSVARFDFSWSDGDYHQKTLENLRIAVKIANKLCAVMLDTVGPQLKICNNTEKAVELKADNFVTITADVTKETSAEVLPINYAELPQMVKKGDTIFLGQHLCTGYEATSVWLEVLEINGQDVSCLVKNSATLVGSMFTMHVSQVHVNLPTLMEIDKQVISNWGATNNIDFISLSYTRHVEDVKELRAFLLQHGLYETQILAKIETVEGLRHFDEILQEADGIILSRGNLGIDLPPEKVISYEEEHLQS